MSDKSIIPASKPMKKKKMFHIVPLSSHQVSHRIVQHTVALRATRKIGLRHITRMMVVMHLKHLFLISLSLSLNSFLVTLGRR